MRILHFYVPIANVSFDLTSGISAFAVINRISSFTRIQRYLCASDIKMCMGMFLGTLHSYSALPNSTQYN